MSWLALRASMVVAAVYGYFLIFAQFSLVELLRASGLGLTQEKTTLGAMAAAGIASGFITAWRGASPGMIRIALGAAGVTALAAPFATGLPSVIFVAITTGASLGVATVALAAVLPAWCGVAWVGVGTGLAYGFCNLPIVFTQSPAVQAWVAAGLALTGLALVPRETLWRTWNSNKVFPFWGVLALFTALVWLDSAAFFIIQHSSELKSGTWGDGLLWRNAAVHFGVAGVAGLGLARGGARILPALAWVLLAVAALAVNAESTRDFTGWFYPAGVSLYSVALVAWPGWFSGVSGMRAAGWRAAWLFAIAGWIGSANGIGMAETLQTVPPMFVAGAGVVVTGVMIFSDLKRWQPAAAVGLVLMTSGIFSTKEVLVATSAAERGREVYLSEGCIHCHSQYIRPGSPDEEFWGPAREVEEVLTGKPVLIGNRRQGPDLTNVGARRSAAWLKLHFMDPRALVPSSPMPSYAHLFESGKGEDLVQYLVESGVNQMPAIVQKTSQWKPAGTGNQNGKALFTTHCAACHGTFGGGYGLLSLNFARPPANLVAGPFAWTPEGGDLPLRVARVIKFGLPGTNMPGHEILTDNQVLSLTDYVLGLRGKP
jgi:cytochrome c oxidase cbb3-type subunit 2